MIILRGLTVLALAVLLAGCSLAVRGTPRPTLAPIPTLPPEATPLPTSMPPCSSAPDVPAGQGAVQLTDFPLAEALEVTDVIWTGTRFVAVGYRALADEGYDGPRQAVVWTSCDGVAWQEVVDPALQYVTPMTLAALGEDVYLLATLSTCGALYADQCQDVAEAGNVVIRSSNGGPWQRLAQEPAMQTAFDPVLETVGDQLVVHGSAADETYTMWLSSDAEAWRTSTNLAGMDPIYALLEQGQGMAALGDTIVEDFEASTLIVATSADGSSFTAVPAPELPGVIINDAISGPGGYAAVGVGYPDNDDFGVVALALNSADGTTWTESASTDDSFGDAQLDQVHVLPDGSAYIALGYRLDVEDFTAQLSKLWRSADGASWQSLLELGTPNSLYTTSAMGPHGLVVFSADQDDTGEETETSVSAYFIPTSEMTP